MPSSVAVFFRGFKNRFVSVKRFDGINIASYKLYQNHNGRRMKTTTTNKAYDILAGRCVHSILNGVNEEFQYKQEE